MKPTLLILAAGMGSRYGGLKQIDAVGASGEAIIEYSIYDAIKAGFGKVVFVIRKSIEAPFKEKFAEKFDHLIETQYVYQEIDTPVAGITDLPAREKPWGTGHAVLVAKNAVYTPFAVINADDYYGADAFHKMAAFLNTRCSSDHYAMVGYTLKNTLSEHGYVNRGVCTVDEHGFLVSVVERTKIQRDDEGKVYFPNEANVLCPLDEYVPVSMNYWGFHPSYFDALEQHFIQFVAENRENPKAEFYIPYVVNKQLEDKEIKLTVLPNDEQWYGVTYQEDRPVVVEAFKTLIENGVYPSSLW